MAQKRLHSKPISKGGPGLTTGILALCKIPNTVLSYLHETGYQALRTTSWFSIGAGLIPGILALYANRQEFPSLHHGLDYQPLYGSSIFSTRAWLIPCLLAVYLPIAMFVPPKIRNKWYTLVLFTIPVGLLCYYILPYHEPYFQAYFCRELEAFLAILLTVTPFCACLEIWEDGELDEVDTIPAKRFWAIVKAAGGVLKQLSWLEVVRIVTGLAFMGIGVYLLWRPL